MIIETHNLTKKYGDKTACDKINLSVEAGQVYGFLGRNGAGKSTCIKILTGLVFPTSGSGTVLGKPLGDVSARQKMGYLPELFRYQDWMTGLDLLNFHAQIIKINNTKEQVNRVLKLVGLEGQEKYKVGSYSKGMQQRIGLASALLSNPELIFFDEPTSALDPIGRRDVRDIIVSLRNEGMTVFLNSHLLSEVEAVCDSVTIIHKGTVVKSARMDELLMNKILLTIRAKGLTEELVAKLKKQFDSLQKLADGSYTILLNDYEQIPSLATSLTSDGVTLYELTPHRETLETVFLQIVGEEGLPLKQS
ncbi:multidrug ABC transporter ATP-binding protein [Desulfuribacillus stibiiarsenatis]|uniref:Multidrug ABC transporter ATP-binding protein n=1 Tax=Desulfuribacillus stibiiarsenatis TaxID=1390249 RepID=A0A1E5L2Y8_9FIRM|nr:ABC transporter ATP-binding protein [Desulfuribacillus stibiiarsenatis]OEH84505.1 multidrug ABC transporter ATP-binding protein [Desulfuribacillus stibiiarsenatis]